MPAIAPPDVPAPDHPWARRPSRSRSGPAPRPGGPLSALVLLALLGMPVPGTALGPAEGPGEPVRTAAREVPRDTTELRERMEAVMAEHGIPGAGVALVSPDSALWVGSLGVADRAEDRPVDRATAFRAGSIAKSAVGMLLMILEGEGELALDAALRDHAPEIPLENPWAPGSPVRIVHLMEHTAGLDDLALPEYARHDPDLSLEEALAARARRVRWPPGSHMAYSNAGVPMAARAVEHVTGQLFEEAIRDRLFLPLGMEGADFRCTPELADRLARGYRRDGRTEVPYAHIRFRPAGGLNLTAGELGRFVRLLLGRGALGDTVLVSPEAVEWMERPATGLAAQAGIRAGYGFGIHASFHDGFVFHGHDGAIDGFLASYGYLRDEGLGYALMVNAESPGFGELRSLVRDFLVRELEPPAPEAPATVPRARLQAWSGYYELLSPRTELTRPLDRILSVVRVDPADPADLTVRPVGGEARPLVATGDHLFRLPEDPVPTVAFLADPEGRRVLVGTGRALEGSYAPVAGWSVWTRWVTGGLVLLLLVSALVVAPVRVARWARDRYPEEERMSVHVLPSAAAASLAAALALALLSGEEIIRRLGTLTVWSGGIFLLTVVFAVLAVAGTVQAIRARAGWTSGAIRSHALAVSAANVLVLLYLAVHGLVGVRLWDL